MKSTSSEKRLVWDNHGCMPLRCDESFLPQLERYRAANVNIISLNVGMADRTLAEHIEVLAYMRRWVAAHPAQYRLISGTSDVRKCLVDNKLGVVFDIEGMGPVLNEVALVSAFYDLGVRWMLIAYNLNNAAGGGCLDADTGLTRRGEEIIREMERVGMVVCLSHTGSRTADEALECAKNPMIFSHSNPYAINPHQRNISDTLIRRCAEKNGVIGLSGIGVYLGNGDDLVGALVREVLYVADLVGPEHVGLGLDYVFDEKELAHGIESNARLFPPDLQVGDGLAMVSPEDVPRIADALMRSRLSEREVRGVLGENWLRVAEQVWR